MQIYQDLYIIINGKVFVYNHSMNGMPHEQVLSFPDFYISVDASDQH